MTPAGAGDGAEVAGLQRRRRRQAGLGRARLRAAPLDAFVRPEEAAPRSARPSRWSSAITGRARRAAGAARLPVDEWGAARFRDGARGAPRPRAAAGGPRRARRAPRTITSASSAQRQPGLNYVGLKTPVGRVTGDQLLELARLAERVRPRRAALHAAAERAAARTCPTRGWATSRRSRSLRELPYNPSEVAARAGRVHRHRLLQPRADRHQDARDGARPRVRAARSAGSRPITVRWSGCPASCGNHHTADVGLQGCKVKVDGKIVDGVHVFVGRPRRRRSARGHADPGGRAVRRAARGARPARPLLPARRAKGDRSVRAMPFVSFVGAGPGEADLITVKALRRLREAAVIVHDRLIAPELLEHAGVDAEIIDAGKAPGRHCLGQSHINWLLVDRARRRGRVVRLKGGDPGVFARLTEEVEAVRAAGIGFEIVPGVSAAMAAAARAGISLTERGRRPWSCSPPGARSATVTLPALDWESAGARRGDARVLHGRRRAGADHRDLAALGRDAREPALIVERVGFADERVLAGPARRHRRARAPRSRDAAGVAAGGADGGRGLGAGRGRLLGDVAGRRLTCPTTSPRSSICVTAAASWWAVGRSASARSAGLLECGARVVLVSPDADGRPRAPGRCRPHRAPCAVRSRRPTSGAARSRWRRPAVRRSIAWWRRPPGAHRVLVNAVDRPARCDFILPSVLRRGQLQIAVSTGGRSPALAREIRRRLEALSARSMPRWSRAPAGHAGGPCPRGYARRPRRRRRASRAPGSGRAGRACLLAGMGLAR